MKGLYDKTRINSRFSGLGDGIIRQVRQLPYDIRDIIRAAGKRPVVIPAVMLLVCSLLSYYFASVFPAVILCVFTAAVCFYIGFTGEHRPADLAAVILTGVMLCSLFLYNGIFISSRLNARAGNGSLRCEVTGVSRDLSGDTVFIVRLNGGALAKVSFYGERGDSVSGGNDRGSGVQRYGDLSDIGPGDTLILEGRLKEPDRPGNPGEFDYAEYLRKQGICYTVSCNSFMVAGKAGFPLNMTGALQNLFFGLRKSAFEAVTASYNDTYKALAAAVCLGDRSLIPDDISRDFNMSCCSHLLAVSGTHFSGFLVCLPVLLNAAGIKRKNMLPVHMIFCVLIGCLTGWSDSVTRAAVMSICVYADREWLSALSLAAVIIMTADPFCALSSGFQMSFCAVIAIKVYGRKIAEFLIRIHFSEGLAEITGTAVSASLGLIPFWSDISMRPDLEHLAVQIAGSVIAGASCTFFVPCVVLCLMFPLLTSYLSAPLLICLKTLCFLVNTGSRLSMQGGAPVRFGKTFLIFLSITVFLSMLPPCMTKRMLLKPAALILAAVMVFESLSILKKPDCIVVFADVGQGDCCLIITPERTCLIDGGTYREGSSTVSDLLDHYGIRQVDLCVMSHWDADHAGGIAALCVSGRTETILTSYVPSDIDDDKDVREFFESGSFTESDRELYLSQLQLVLAGERIMLSDMVFLDVLYPSESSGGGNESSLVVMLHVLGEDETSILFTGDIGTATEEVLIGQGTDLDCDILKVAHHGSKYSSSYGFIEACSPEIAVISVGANNFYGHPAPATLERFEAYGCKVFRTDIEGAVILEY